MRRQTRGDWERWLCVRTGTLLAVLLAAVALLPARALAQGTHEFPDTSRTGSIIFEMRDAQGDAVPGGELAVYQVATVTVDNGFHFTYTSDFADYAEDATIAEDADVAAMAEALTAYALSNGLTGQAVTIGSDGNATLGDLELGVYLVVQTQNAPGYRFISPFTVTIPYAEDLSDPNDVYVYDVLARPKCGTVAKMPPCDAGLPLLEKIVSGTGAPTDTSFEFMLTRLDSASPLPNGVEGFVSLSGDTLTVRRSGAGTLELGTLTFEEAGSYVYTLSEVKGSASGYTYDTTVYRIEYTVVEQDNALLVSEAVVRKGGASGEKLFEGTDASKYTCVFDNPYGETPPSKTPPKKPTPKGPLAKTGDYLLPLGGLVALGIVLVIVGVVRKRRRV